MLLHMHVGEPISRMRDHITASKFYLYGTTYMEGGCHKLNQIGTLSLSDVRRENRFLSAVLQVNLCKMIQLG